MYRCASAAVVALAMLGFDTTALAQARNFPQNTLRGAMVFGDYPAIELNGTVTTLTPGSHVRNQDNMLVMASSLEGAKWLVNYTLDMNGDQVREVWILRPEEAAMKPWPRTLVEAQTWTFDATTQTWTKP